MSSILLRGCSSSRYGYANTLGDSKAISVGRTTSASYTRTNGVSPVALLVEVWVSHRVEGSSSIQCWPLFLSLSKVLVLSPFRTRALALSACSLLRGCAMEAKKILVPKPSRYVVKAELVNCVPLSVMIRLGTPKRQTIPWMKLIDHLPEDSHSHI